MNCPKCPEMELERFLVPIKDRSTPGPAESMRAVEVDMCASCGGVWFDKGELDRYLDARTLPLPPMAEAVDKALDARTGKCPRCGVDLVKAPAPGNPRLTADRCGSCEGIWFDAGELEKAGGKGLPLAERLKAAFGGLG